MKIMNRIISFLLVCVLFAFSLPVHAATGTGKDLYVSLAGSDSYTWAQNDIDHPWLTPKKAWESAQAGDTVNFREGTYVIAEPFCTKYSGGNGTEENPIVFQSYPGETATFDGGTLSDPAGIICIQKNWNIIRNLNFTGGYTFIMFGYDVNVQGGGVEHCTARDSIGDTPNNQAFIYLDSGATDITIKDCDIGGGPTASSCIIAFNARGLKVLHNNLHNAGGAVYYKHGHGLPDYDTGIEIAYNYIHDLRENGYPMQLNTRYAYIHDNLIIGTSGSGFVVCQGNGGDSNGGGANNRITHNTICNTVFSLDPGDYSGAIYNTMQDNIFADKMVEVFRYSDKAGYETNTFDYNLYKTENAIVHNRVNYTLMAWQTFFGGDAHSLSGSPVFTNGSGALSEISDFVLAGGSPGKNAASDGKDMGADISLVIDPYATYPEESDKTVLNAAILQAQGLNFSAYTQESWAALQAALMEAHTVREDEDATQAEVNDAADALEEAISNLVPSGITGISLDRDDYALRTAGSQTRTIAVTANLSTSGTLPLTEGVVYTSEDEDVATVNSQGVITAVAQGQTRINVQYGDFQAQAGVFVLPPEPDGTSQEVVKESNYAQASWLFSDDFEVDRLASYYDYVNFFGRFKRGTTGEGYSGVGIGNTYGMRSLYGYYNGDAANHPNPYGTWLKLAVGKTTDNTLYKPVANPDTAERELYWRFYVKNYTQAAGGILGSSPIAQVYGYGSNLEGTRVPFMSVNVYYPGDESGILESEIKTGIFDSWGKPISTTADGTVIRGKMPVMQHEFANQWHVVQIHVKLNDAGQANGKYELWVDEQLQASADGLDWVGDYTEYGINDLVIYNTNQQQGVPGGDNECRMFDNMVVSRTKIAAPGTSDLSNANLMSVRSSTGKWDPDIFEPSRMEYTVDVEYGTEQLSLTAQTVLPGSVVTVGGNAYANGEAIPVQLQGGTTVVYIEVTAPDGITNKTYVVNVVCRKPYQVNEAEDPKADWIFWDDFEEDRMGQYSDRTNDDRFYRSEGVGLGGSTGMKADFRVADGEGYETGSIRIAFGRNPVSWMTPVGAFGEDLKEIYVRFYVKNEKDWVGGGADKLARISAFQSNNMSQSMIAHIWSEGEGKNYLAIDPASGTDEAGNLISTKWNDFDNLRWLGMKPSNIPIFDIDHVGEWYAVETHVKLNDPGQSNGIFELWIDDKLQASSTNLNWIGSFEMGEGKGYGINWFGLENYWGDGTPVDQERYFDNLVVSRSKIGLAEVESSVGNPVATLTGPTMTGDGKYKLTYGLEGAKDITAQDVTVSYDKNLFDFVTAEPVSDGTGIVLDPVVNTEAGTVRFVLTSLGEGNEVNGKAEILDMFFRPKANATGTIAVTSVQLADKSGKEGIFADTEGASKTIVIAEAAALISAIQFAQGIYNSAVEGVQTGQYPDGAKDRLDTAIDAAIAVRDDVGAGPEDISNAIEILNTAVAKFQSLIITDETGNINDTPGIGLGDLGMIAFYYGKTFASEGSGWNAIMHMDINGDGEIGPYELTFIVRRIIGILN